MLAAGCGRPGTAGIFTRTGRTWQLTGPALPAAYAREAITVLQLTTTGGTTTALLAAGTGSAARLLAGWSADGGALAVHGTQLSIWQAAPGALAWAREQVIKVPVQFGSSG
jgi:hypothetical protein